MKKNFFERIMDIGKKEINIIPAKKHKEVEKPVEEKKEIKPQTKEEKIVSNLKINVTDDVSEKQKKIVEQKHQTVMLFFADRMKEVTKPCNAKDGKNKVLDTIQDRLQDLNFNIESEEKFKERYNEGKAEHLKNNVFMPAGYYSIAENTVYMKVEPYLREGLGKGELPKIVMSTLIHETLHGVSTNQKDKLGLMTVEKSGKNEEKIIGRGFNEAATVDLTEKVVGKTRVNGYSEDYKEVLNTVRTIADIKEKEYLNMYFLDNKWYTKDLERRFNPSEENREGLKKIVENYDNRSINTKFNKNTVVKNLYEGFSNNYIEKDAIEQNKYKEKFVGNMEDIVNYFETEDVNLETEKYIKKAQKTKLERINIKIEKEEQKQDKEKNKEENIFELNTDKKVKNKEKDQDEYIR